MGQVRRMQGQGVLVEGDRGEDSSGVNQGASYPDTPQGLCPHPKRAQVMVTQGQEKPCAAMADAWSAICEGERVDAWDSERIRGITGTPGRKRALSSSSSDRSESPARQAWIGAADGPPWPMRSASDIRRRYCMRLGVRDNRIKAPQHTSSCLPAGYRVLVERLKDAPSPISSRSKRKGQPSGALKAWAAGTTRRSCGGGGELDGGGGSKGGGKKGIEDGGGGRSSSRCGGDDGGNAGSSSSANGAVTSGTSMKGCSSTATKPTIHSGACTAISVIGETGSETGSSLVSDTPNISPTHSGACVGTTHVTGVCAAPRRKGALKRPDDPSLSHTTHTPHTVRLRGSVEVVRIPSHRDYSERVRNTLWWSWRVLREMRCRNYVEFASEGCDVARVLEEGEMYLDPVTGEYVHPATVALMETLRKWEDDEGSC